MVRGREVPEVALIFAFRKGPDSVDEKWPRLSGACQLLCSTFHGC